MAEYDSARRLARRLIDKKGRTLIHRTKEAAETLPDEDEPWNPAPNVPGNTNVRGVIFPAKREYIEGTLVRISEKVAYIAASQSEGAADLVVTQKDVIVDGGKEYRIEELQLLNPGEQDVLYILGLRGK